MTVRITLLSSDDPVHSPALTGSVGTRMWRGIELGLPIFLGYMPVGMAFGILANERGFTTLQAVVCSATALAGAGQFIALSFMAAGADVFETLTSRERLVLQLAAEGRSAAVIGEQLFISPRTAETHRTNLMRKLGLHSQTDLVRYAIRKRILPD